MNHHSGEGCCGCSSHDTPLTKKGAALAHWERLRFSSLLLVPVIVWLIISIVSLVGKDYTAFTGWLSTPANAGLLVMFIVLSCYHGALGVQEIIEDYISTEKTAHCAIIAEKLAFALVAAICLVSIGKIAL